jgi:hypothetical protein
LPNKTESSVDGTQGGIPQVETMDARDEEEETLEYQSETVLTIMQPVSITMIFVVWAVKTINLALQSAPQR